MMKRKENKEMKKFFYGTEKEEEATHCCLLSFECLVSLLKLKRKFLAFLSNA
jgi:hypothetical protein